MVFDASALIAFLKNEDGATEVHELLNADATQGFVHAVNLCEVYYGYRRSHGEMAAQQAINTLAGLGVSSREDMDPDFWQAAGRIKAERRRVSLADCFCIALARRLNGEVVTADHHEFDAIASLEICPIRFIR